MPTLTTKLTIRNKTKLYIRITKQIITNQQINKKGKKKNYQVWYKSFHDNTHIHDSESADGKVFTEIRWWIELDKKSEIPDNDYLIV